MSRLPAWLGPVGAWEGRTASSCHARPADAERQECREDLLLPVGFQLERARTLLADPGDLTIDDIKGFITASEAAEAGQRAEDEAREHQRQAAELEAANAVAAASRRVARRTLAGLVAALALAAVAIGIGIYARSQTAEAVSQKAEAEHQKTEAEAQRTEAEKQASLADAKTKEAEANFREGQQRESYFRAEQAKQAGADAVTAALLALEGLPDSTSADDAQRTRPFVNDAWHRARLAQLERAVLDGHTGAVNSAVFAPDGNRILTAS
jgi:hypothetical protein